MAGLVIDIIVVFLFKSTVRAFGFFESSKWERTRASLTDWAMEDPGWGCPSIRLNYEFVTKDDLTAGADEVPFYLRWHAKAYAEELSRGLQLIIRVNPRNPQETRFFHSDQKAAATAA